MWTFLPLVYTLFSFSDQGELQRVYSCSRSCELTNPPTPCVRKAVCHIQELRNKLKNWCQQVSWKSTSSLNRMKTSWELEFYPVPLNDILLPRQCSADERILLIICLFISEWLNALCFKLGLKWSPISYSARFVDVNTSNELRPFWIEPREPVSVRFAFSAPHGSVTRGLWTQTAPVRFDSFHPLGSP